MRAGSVRGQDSRQGALWLNGMPSRRPCDKDFLRGAPSVRVQGSHLGSQSYPELSLLGGWGEGGREEEGRRENHETKHEHTGKGRAADDSWPTVRRQTGSAA